MARELNEGRLTLTPDEVARLLGIGRGTCYEAIRQGSIPSVRCGRRILVSRVGLARWLEGKGPGSLPDSNVATAAERPDKLRQR